jgi:predicted tellurium resistance membrane protein TerC
VEYLVALAALTAMEIVLGIDNIVFIAVLVGRLPESQRAKARQLGLAFALLTRIALLLTISYIVNELTDPIFQLTDLGIPESWLVEEVAPNDLPASTDPGSGAAESAGHGMESWLTSEVNDVSWKDLLLFFGGLFLIYKSVVEIHKKVEGGEEHLASGKHASFTTVLIEIGLFDVLFSLDSVITAVGMVKGDSTGLAVMVTAIVVAMIVMLVFAGKVSDFIEKHPTLKILALSFLILIGVMLVAEGIGTHFDRKYIYFAMAFSLIVEMVNMRIRLRKKRIQAA